MRLLPIAALSAAVLFSASAWADPVTITGTIHAKCPAAGTPVSAGNQDNFNGDCVITIVSGGKTYTVQDKFNDYRPYDGKTVSVTGSVMENLAKEYPGKYIDFAFGEWKDADFSPSVFAILWRMAGDPPDLYSTSGPVAVAGSSVGRNSQTAGSPAAPRTGGSAAGGVTR